MRVGVGYISTAEATCHWKERTQQWIEQTTSSFI